MKVFSRDREGAGSGRRGLDSQNLAIAVAAGGRIHDMGEMGLASLVAAELGQGTAVRDFRIRIRIFDVFLFGTPMVSVLRFELVQIPPDRGPSFFSEVVLAGSKDSPRARTPTAAVQLTAGCEREG